MTITNAPLETVVKKTSYTYVHYVECNKMGGTCGACGGGESCAQDFGGEV